jgi:hypothetical protein
MDLQKDVRVWTVLISPRTEPNVNMAMSIRTPTKTDNLMNSGDTTSFSRRDASCSSLVTTAFRNVTYGVLSLSRRCFKSRSSGL